MSEDENKPEQRDERRHLPPQGRAPEQPIDVTPEPRTASEVPPADDQPRS